MDFWAYFGHFSLVKGVNIECPIAQGRSAQIKKLKKIDQQWNFIEVLLGQLKGIQDVSFGPIGQKRINLKYREKVNIIRFFSHKFSQILS